MEMSVTYDSTRKWQRRTTVECQRFTVHFSIQ